MSATIPFGLFSTKIFRATVRSTALRTIKAAKTKTWSSVCVALTIDTSVSLLPTWSPVTLAIGGSTFNKSNPAPTAFVSSTLFPPSRSRTMSLTAARAVGSRSDRYFNTSSKFSARNPAIRCTAPSGNSRRETSGACHNSTLLD